MTQLAHWKSNPDQLEDEGVLVPTAALVGVAEDVAEVLCDNAVDPPDVLLPNGDGGIVLRWRLPSRTWSIEMDADGSINPRYSPVASFCGGIVFTTIQSEYHDGVTRW